eukprot:366028-Chlamydomonas_euryale.AAC.27
MFDQQLKTARRQHQQDSDAVITALRAAEGCLTRPGQKKRCEAWSLRTTRAHTCSHAAAMLTSPRGAAAAGRGQRQQLPVTVLPDAKPALCTALRLTLSRYVPAEPWPGSARVRTQTQCMHMPPPRPGCKARQARWVEGKRRRGMRPGAREDRCSGQSAREDMRRPEVACGPPCGTFAASTASSLCASL